MSDLNKFGQEMPDPQSFVRIEHQAPPSLAQQVRELVQNHMSKAAAEAGFETLEESIDFDVADPFDLDENQISKYQVFLDEYPADATASAPTVKNPEIPPPIQGGEAEETGAELDHQTPKNSADTQ